MTLDQPTEIGFELVWNEQEHGWQLVSTGEVLEAAAIHTEIRAHAAIAETMFSNITVALYDSGMSIGAWQGTMLDELRDGHTANAIFGAGGVGNMTPEALARLEATIAKEAGHLADFAQGISDGSVSPLKARDRASQYAKAMEQSYWNEWKADLDNPEWAHLPLLSQVPGDGGTKCFGNCQCTLLFNDDGVEWSLGVADHEADCLALAAGGPYRMA